MYNLSVGFQCVFRPRKIFKLGPVKGHVGPVKGHAGPAERSIWTNFNWTISVFARRIVNTMRWLDEKVISVFHRTIGKTVSSDWYFRVRDKIILLKWYFLFMKNLTLWTGNSTKSVERAASIVGHGERQSLFSI